jgi:hypothetical protein
MIPVGFRIAHIVMDFHTDCGGAIGNRKCNAHAGEEWWCDEIHILARIREKAHHIIDMATKEKGYDGM